MDRAASAAPGGKQRPRPLLRLDAVTLRYRTRQRLVTAAVGIDLDLIPGERVVLLGPSGCGKSSLLKAVAGFLPPAAGRILLDGEPVRGPGPDRMVVFQEFDQLPPWKTVLGNVMFPLLASRRCARPEARLRATVALEKVGLEGFAHAYPHQLSGGMKQRVAIARALAMEPAILLMDEPFAALDALTRRRMQDELLGLWRAQPFTCLFVTHSIEEAVLVGSRVVVLSPHPGRITAELAAAEPDRGPAGSPGFLAAVRHLHGLLFDERRAAA